MKFTAPSVRTGAMARDGRPPRLAPRTDSDGRACLSCTAHSAAGGRGQLPDSWSAGRAVRLRLRQAARNCPWPAPRRRSACRAGGRPRPEKDSDSDLVRSESALTLRRPNLKLGRNVDPPPRPTGAPSAGPRGGSAASPASSPHRSWV
jgi:hypothetical protein